MVAVTKKLVLAFREITSIYENPAQPEVDKDTTKRTLSKLTDCIAMYAAQKDITASASKILEKSKEIAEELAKLCSHERAHDSTTDETKKVLLFPFRCFFLLASFTNQPTRKRFEKRNWKMSEE